MAATISQLQKVESLQAFKDDWEKSERNDFLVPDGQVLKFENAHWMRFTKSMGNNKKPLDTIVLVSDEGIKCFKSWTRPRYYAEKNISESIPLGHYGSFIELFKKIKEEISSYLLGQEVKGADGNPIPKDTLDAPDLIARKHLKGKSFMVHAIECQGYHKDDPTKKAFFTRYYIHEVGK